MSTLLFHAVFTASKVGVNGLTVTVDIDRFTRSDGTRTALVTGGSATATTRRGLYYYSLSGADLTLYDYVCTFVTADTSVDAKEVPALWTHFAEDASLQADALTNTSLAASAVTEMQAGLSTFNPATTNVTVGSLATAALQQWFTTDTGKVYSDAIDGSILKETLDGVPPSTVGAAAIWAYASRTLTQSASTIVAAVTGDKLAIYRGDTWNATITGLAPNTGFVSILLTVKADKGDTDAQAILQIRKNASGLNDGLIYLNGAAPVSPVVASDASITVNSATSLTIILAARASDDLVPAGKLVYDIQYIFASSVLTASEGVLDITGDVTRAIV